MNEKSALSRASHTPQAHCPKCGEPLSFEIMTQLMADSRMSFVLQAKPGELMSARTIGGSLVNMEKLLVSVGKELGANTTVAVEGISYIDGAVKFDLLLSRIDKGVKTRKPNSHTESSS